MGIFDIIDRRLAILAETTFALIVLCFILAIGGGVGYLALGKCGAVVTVVAILGFIFYPLRDKW